MSTGIEGISSRPSSLPSSSHTTQSNHDRAPKTEEVSGHLTSSSSSHNLPDYKGKEVNVAA